MSGVPGMPWPAWDHGVEGRALRPASPAEGDSARCGAGRGGPAHRARGGTPSPQGRFKYACSARCAAGMRSAHTPHSSGVGGRRWVPGRRDKKKRKEKKGSPSNKELTPPLFFSDQRHQVAPLQGPSARRRLAVSAGRRAREWREKEETRKKEKKQPKAKGSCPPPLFFSAHAHCFSPVGAAFKAPPHRAATRSESAGALSSPSCFTPPGTPPLPR